MEKKRISGCTIVTIIGVLMVVGAVSLLVFLISLLFDSRDEDEAGQSSSSETVAAREPVIATMEDGCLVYDPDHWPVFEPLRKGDSISRDRFVVFGMDDDLTDLAKENFRELAEGAPVEWELMIYDLREEDGGLAGTFMIPYEIRGRKSGQLYVTARFGEDQRDPLLKLRKREWVTVAGTLSLNQHDFVITDARIYQGGGDD